MKIFSWKYCRMQEYTCQIFFLYAPARARGGRVHAKWDSQNRSWGILGHLLDVSSFPASFLFVLGVFGDITFCFVKGLPFWQIVLLNLPWWWTLALISCFSEGHALMAQDKLIMHSNTNSEGGAKNCISEKYPVQRIADAKCTETVDTETANTRHPHQPH